jgi:hypothetical protein
MLPVAESAYGHCVLATCTADVAARGWAARYTLTRVGDISAPPPPDVHHTSTLSEYRPGQLPLRRQLGGGESTGSWPYHSAQGAYFHAVDATTHLYEYSGGRPSAVPCVAARLTVSRLTVGPCALRAVMCPTACRIVRLVAHGSGPVL